MAGIYETWARLLRFSWMTAKAQEIWGAFGKVLGDFTLADMRAALLERLPQFASAVANGLTANDRRIIRGPTETDAGFAARLVRAPLQWRLGGTPLGMLIQLYYAGFPQAILVQQNGLAIALSSAPDLDDLEAAFLARTAPSWLTITELPHSNPFIPASTDGKPAIPMSTVSWWTFATAMDAAGNQWNSRFAVIFPAETLDGGITYHAVVDLTIADNLTRIRTLIAEWKPAKATCVYIAVATQGEFWDWPIDTWDPPGADFWDSPPPVIAYYTP